MAIWPTPIPDWFWSWAEWRLGRNAFKGHGCDLAYRPKSSPDDIPKWAWVRLALLAAGKPLPAKTVRQKALAALTSRLGVTESPADSNRCWASAWYGMVGPWCAMSASWAYVTAGSRRFVKGRAYAYVPYIVADARANRNGLSLTSSPIAGDLACYDWERNGVSDHVGIFERWVTKGKTFYAIEGNTSLGSDSNGGEVMRRLRNVGNVQAFVRVTE